MEKKKEFRILFLIIAVFLTAFFLPIESIGIKRPVLAMLDLTKWYAREHVILCLLPDFFIAGVIGIIGISVITLIDKRDPDNREWTMASWGFAKQIMPILQGLSGAGMGKGPALAMLLAGPSLSLPNMLVIRGVIGTEKTLVYVFLVVVMATVSGLVFGAIV